MTTNHNGNGQDPTDGGQYCGARKKNGDYCRSRAGWGTDHPGIGRCRKHLGNTPDHVKHAQRQQAAQVVATYGLPRDINPHDALLEEVHRTAGHVAWLSDIVAELDTDAIVRGVTKVVTSPDGRTATVEAAVNVWVRLYQDERERLRRVAVAAIQAGVDERRVQLEEATAVHLAQVIRHVITDLGHDPADDRVRSVVRRRMTTGAAA